MNDLKPVFCNRSTNTITPIRFNDPSGDCPTKEVMSIVSISQDWFEAERILWGV